MQNCTFVSQGTPLDKFQGPLDFIVHGPCLVCKVALRVCIDRTSSTNHRGQWMIPTIGGREQRTFHTFTNSYVNQRFGS